MEKIVQIDDLFIEKHTDFSDLISALKKGFSQNNILVPQRHHHDFPNEKVNSNSTLLLMPAWSPSNSAGVKIITVSPENSQFNLPSIQGVYVYFDSTTGVLKAIIEAKKLTVKRTAAASALASSYLSKKNASKLLMIGTGALSTNLILAHASVRPIKKVFVWGRNFEKAKSICDSLKNEVFECVPITSIEDEISNVDIISSATLSTEPLIFGKHLINGQHIDLVGSYKKNMREADDETILKSNVFLDTYQGGLTESGDILIPIEKNILSRDTIKADLFELCSEEKNGRQNDTEITLFKSVGHAIEDLIAADYYYNKYIHG